MGLFEIIMVIYIPIGTFVLNELRKIIKTKNSAYRIFYLASSIVMAVTPFIYIKYFAINYSAIAVVLVGISLFWFVIVGGRVANTSQANKLGHFLQWAKIAH